MTTLKHGGTYTTRDKRTVTVERTRTGSYHDVATKRYFTEKGGCIAYYRGDEPIIEETKSIDLPPDPEADIEAEIMADEEAARDPHRWMKLQEAPYPYSWCHDCGALRVVVTIHGGGQSTEIKLPREYHTCGTNKSKKPARR